MTVQTDEPRPVLSFAPAKLIVGIALGLVGILLTADNFGYLDAGDYLRLWPVVLLALGFVKLADSGSRDLAIVLLVVGAWVLAFNLGLIGFTFFDLWPLILILIGIGFVRRAFQSPSEVRADPLRTLASREDLALLTTRRVRPGPVFNGGRFAAILGTYQLDLTATTLEHDPTVIEVRAFLGGVEVFVPDGWEVIGEVFPVMGGFEMKTGRATEPRRRLVVRGFALMAGVEVNHVERIGS